MSVECELLSGVSCRARAKLRVCMCAFFDARPIRVCVCVSFNETGWLRRARVHAVSMPEHARARRVLYIKETS